LHSRYGKAAKRFTVKGGYRRLPERKA